MRLHRKCTRRGKSRVDDREQRLGVAGLRNERRAKGGCQCLGFGRDVSGGPKHDARLDRIRVRAQIEGKLTAVHARREDVDDHQVGAFGANDPQRFLAAPSLQQTMPPAPEQRRDEAQIDGSVLDDKNCGHEPPRFIIRYPSTPLFFMSDKRATDDYASVMRQSSNENVTDGKPKGGVGAPQTAPHPKARLRPHHFLPLNHLSADASSRKLWTLTPCWRPINSMY